MSLVDEPRRLAMLLAQRSRPGEEPPASLRRLMNLGDESLRAEALEALRGATQELREPGLAPAQRQNAETTVYWLTIALYRGLVGPERARHQRGLVEGALEVIEAPSRRQSLHGMLARNAARAGDLDAAAEWVALLDPRSGDLRSESSYRLSLAYLQSASGRFGDVLVTLGEDVAEVPLAGNDELLASILRANAHEGLGDANRASIHLAALMRHHEAYPALIEEIVKSNAGLNLCADSLGPARQLAVQ